LRLFEKISNFKLIILVSIFLVLFDNIAFFRNVINVYPVSLNNIAFLGSLAVVLTSFITLLLTLVCSKYTTKPILISILLLSSIVSYFMNTYNTVFDTNMLRNILQTNSNESLDLVNFKLVLYFLLLGVLPSIFIYKINITYGSIKTELISKLKIILMSLFIIILTGLSLSKFYTSFLRENKPLRYYTNPTYYMDFPQKSRHVQAQTLKSCFS